MKTKENDFSINNESLSSIIESIITGVCIFALGENRRILPVYLNEGMYRMLGYNHKELDFMLKDIRRSIIPDDMPVFEEGIDNVLKDDGAVEFEFRTVTGDGGIRWLQVRANLYGKMDGYPLAVAVVIDATERKSIEEELALQAERINILSESIKEHIVDYNSRTDTLNIKLDRSLHKKGEIIVKSFMESYDFLAVHEDDIQVLRESLGAARRSPISDSIDFRSTFFEGNGKDYEWYRVTFSSVRGADGYVSRIVGRVVNVNDDKKKELELKLKADKDGLTGLYNKETAKVLMAEAMLKGAREGFKSAMIMLDLDHFKSVNDTFGHSTGDRLLEAVGRILNDTFKGRDIVGRVGGDEFMILMTDIKGAEDAVGISNKLNKFLTKRISNSQGEVTVTASIGISIADSENYEFEKLYAQADAALYETKQRGRNGNTLFK